MKYTVQENASFIANGRIYAPGDEINSDSFKFKKTLEKAVSGGKLKPVQDTPAADASASPGASGGGNTDSGSPSNSDVSGGADAAAIAPKKRKAMEKAVIDNGLRNPEEIKSLSDKDLAELLTAAGVGV
jgi:hypothetical protein